jgi:hypothetical protein
MANTIRVFPLSRSPVDVSHKNIARVQQFVARLIDFCYSN